MDQPRGPRGDKQFLYKNNERAVEEVPVTTLDASREAILVGYRLGLVHAERKDLDVTHVAPTEPVQVDLDFDVKAVFDLKSVETDIKLERDLWDSNIAVRVKGIFRLEEPLSSVEDAKQFVKSTALVRTLHVCYAEIDRLARELDVTVRAAPLDIEEGLQNVEPEFVGEL